MAFLTPLVEGFPIILPALLISILIIISHVPLGQVVLNRGIIFIDLAISQVTVFGYIIGQWLATQYFHFHHHDDIYNSIIKQVFAYTSAIVCACSLFFIRALTVRKQEAVIGIIFILAATGCILFLSVQTNASESLKQILTGNILWVNYSDVLICLAMTVVFVILWFVLKFKQSSFWFYPIFAVLITMSTQLIGIYLVFTTLIVPALVGSYFKKSLLASYIISLCGYILGLLLSLFYDLPSGAIIAWSVIFLAFLVFLMIRLKLQRV